MVGSVDAEGNGNSGIEQKLNADLQGRPGRMRVLTDSLQDPYITYVSDPGEQGANVTLTIHNVIQHVAERALEEGIAAAHAQQGSAVVMDPTTARSWRWPITRASIRRRKIPRSRRSRRG